MAIYAILDFETTGLDPATCQITEIACVKTNLLRDLGTFHTYVQLKEGHEIPQKIQDYTGVTPYHTSLGLPEEDAIRMLEQFIKGDGTEEVIVVAQHAPFDFSFMDKYGYHPDRFLCTRTLSAILEPDQSASLAKVYKRLFGEEVPGHHSALYDVRATEKVLVENMRRMLDRDIPIRLNVLVETIDRPLTYRPPHATIETL